MGWILKIRSFLLPLCGGLWGCVLLRLYASGQLSQVQNPAYHNITLVFSLLLILACLAFPFFFDAPSESSSGTWYSAPGKGLLLLLPIAAYLLLPEEILTTSFLKQRSSLNLLSPGALQRFLPGKPGELRRLLLEQVQDVPKTETVPLDLLELIYLSQDAELRDHYNGQQVSLPGQWLSDDADHFKIARLLIFCCAADGRTLTLRVNGHSDLQEDGTWIEITGTLRFSPGTPVPELNLIECRKMDGPPDAGM
jgi:uncharacterized membrane protein YcgQ (UPF0703/DUF1980 family)